MSISAVPSLTNAFHWKGITLYQDERVLKAGTDALLLATWIPTKVRETNSILDVGTGSGILAVLMAQSFQGSLVTAIDPDENAAHLARLNADLSDHRNRIHVEQAGLLEYASSSNLKFDLLLSNPPFYVNHILPAAEHLQSAKHSTSSPASWMSAFEKLISNQGCICIVVPTLIAFEWIREANAIQLYCSKRMDVYSFAGDKQSKRSLLCFHHELCKPQHEMLIMYTGEKIYTEEYATWLGL